MKSISETYNNLIQVHKVFALFIENREGKKCNQYNNCVLKN